MKKIFLALLSVSFVSFIIISPFGQAYGADCSKPEELFSSSYNTTFNFSAKGDANITQGISLKNLSSDCFVSEFNLKLNSGSVKNVSGSDSLGTMKVDVKKNLGSTDITARLNDEVIGLGKSVVFTLKYTVSGLAQKQGNIWDVSVPNLTINESISSYNLRVVVPSSYGETFSISEKPKTNTKQSGSTVLTYDKSVLDTRSVSISFGNGQVVGFQFTLPLENKGFLPKKFIVPIPPDTQNQQVYFQSLEPMPNKITMDDFGNYLAEYSVSARSFLEAKVSGVIKIVNKDNLLPPTLEKNSEYIEKFKSASGFVQTQDGAIQEKAKELGGSKQIYDFVIESLVFDENTGKNKDWERKGAAAVLSKIQNVGTAEFVDLFTALARAAQIPTRQVVGVVVKSGHENKPTYLGQPVNSENLHIWAQVYSEQDQAWLDVDPVWGSTTQTNFHGKILSDRVILWKTDSDYGLEYLENYSILTDGVDAFYRSGAADFSKDVDLDIIADQAVAGFPAEVSIEIQNNKGVSLVGAKLDLELEGLTLVGEDSTKIDVLLPFEKKVLKYKARGGDLLGKSEGTILAILSAEDQEDFKLEKQEQIKVAAFFSVGYQQFLLLALLVLLLAGIIGPRFSKKSSKLKKEKPQDS